MQTGKTTLNDIISTLKNPEIVGYRVSDGSYRFLKTIGGEKFIVAVRDGKLKTVIYADKGISGNFKIIYSGG